MDADANVSNTTIEKSLRTTNISVKDCESLDYDTAINEPYWNYLTRKLKAHGSWYGAKKEVMSWIVIFFIGVFTGLVAFFIDVIVKSLSAWKLNTVTNSMVSCNKSGCIVTSLLILLAFNLVFVFVASALVVFVEPLAAGSGIPEIKCYLNGVKIRNVVRSRTLLAKAIGVLFSVSGGLLVGKEGPMIHSGGVIGAGIPQFQIPSIKNFKLNIPYFRTDRAKRDFVSAGAAAGVAAAFGAPIGGVLFSLEEGSSFWNQSLTWKTLFCTMTSTFTLNLFLSGVEDNSWGSFNQNGLLTFGVFKCDSSEKCSLWTAGDLLIFIVMGFVGGILGALFNKLNTMLTLRRLKHVTKRPKHVRILEVLFIAQITTMISFIAPFIVGTCKTMTTAKGGNMSTAMEVQQFLCPNGTYNDMATLIYNTQESAIKQLFHLPGAFSLASLAAFFILFFLLACWTYGSSVPSGLFVPCILCGASYGRFCANILSNVFAVNHIYLGTLSLIGAAAFLGGVVRMTISLTVILIECTNEISFAIPIMVTLMIAKWSGDIFNHGLYDIHVTLKKIPLLEWDIPHKLSLLRACDVMKTRLKYIYPHTRVQSIVNLLRTTAHNAYPVVTIQHSQKIDESFIELTSDSNINQTNNDFKASNLQSRMEIERQRAVSLSHANTELVRVNQHDDACTEHLHSSVESDNVHDNLQSLVFHGMMLRSTLTTLIKQNVFYKSDTEQHTDQPIASHEELCQDYPRFADIHDCDTTDIVHTNVMDVTSYMNSSPYVVYVSTPISQVFNLFRTMGLRHLPVINNNNEIVGIITRHDLTHERLEEAVELTDHAD